MAAISDTSNRGEVLGMPSIGTIGFQTRVDDIHARLGTHTTRMPTGTTTDSDILEASYAPFVKAEVQPTSVDEAGRWIALRKHLLSMCAIVCTTCAEQPAGRTSSSIVLPKMNLILGPWASTEFFANYGEGFHSNDARSAVAPGSSPLARAKSYEVGVRSKPWGPEGVEFIATPVAIGSPVGTGVCGRRRDDGNSRTQQTRGRGGRRARAKCSGPLYVNGSLTWTKAEFRNGDAIPLAPEYTAYGAVILKWPEGLTSQLQATYLGVRPLIEDRSIASPSWLTFDVSERYRLPITLPHGRMEAFLFVRNLFNTEWEQAIFAFESRLRNEAAGVTDIHFVPGNPRMFMGGVAWYF